MATIVARDLIKSSLRLIGAIATGETPSAEESNDALFVLNDMLDAYALENLMLYRNENDGFTLTPSKQIYTIGAGGDFNVTRPVTIEGAFINYNGIDFQLKLLNTEQWNSIPIKTLSSPIPTTLTYFATNPLGSLYLWPVPTLAIPITLSVNMQFARLASINDTLAFPPGYLKFLRYQLAIELAPEYGLQVPATVVAIASDMMANLKVANAQQQVSEFDPALTGSAGPGTLGIAGFIGGY